MKKLFYVLEGIFALICVFTMFFETLKLCAVVSLFLLFIFYYGIRKQIFDNKSYFFCNLALCIFLFVLYLVFKYVFSSQLAYNALDITSILVFQVFALYSSLYFSHRMRG